MVQPALPSYSKRIPEMRYGIAPTKPAPISDAPESPRYFVYCRAEAHHRGIAGIVCKLCGGKELIELAPRKRRV